MLDYPRVFSAFEVVFTTLALVGLVACGIGLASSNRRLRYLYRARVPDGSLKQLIAWYTFWTQAIIGSILLLAFTFGLAAVVTPPTPTQYEPTVSTWIGWIFFLYLDVALSGMAVFQQTVFSLLRRRLRAGLMADGDEDEED